MSLVTVCGQYAKAYITSVLVLEERLHKHGFSLCSSTFSIMVALVVVYH